MVGAGAAGSAGTASASSIPAICSTFSGCTPAPRTTPARSITIVTGFLQWAMMSVLSGQVLAVMPVAVEQIATAALYPVVAYVFVLTHRSILRED